ncbi:hypothetical protein [Arthrobacter sp. A5]|uniref:hypothetical protein n=1 Tax=Arthrobacter sp. A5 TaxID=576926 RepID=UPI003DA9F284
MLNQVRWSRTGAVAMTGVPQRVPRSETGASAVGRPGIWQWCFPFREGVAAMDRIIFKAPLPGG